MCEEGWGGYLTISTSSPVQPAPLPVYHHEHINIGNAFFPLSHHHSLLHEQKKANALFSSRDNCTPYLLSADYCTTPFFYLTIKHRDDTDVELLLLNYYSALSLVCGDPSREYFQLSSVRRSDFSKPTRSDLFSAQKVSLTELYYTYYTATYWGMREDCCSRPQ